MAVFPDLPGIEVTICVDGKPLTEYLDDKMRKRRARSEAAYGSFQSGL